MKNYNKYTYLITLNNIPGWGPKKVNQILQLLINKSILIEDLFMYDLAQLSQLECFSKLDLEKFEESKKELPNNSFLVENLISQGFSIIPIFSKEYSATLQNNLSNNNAPPILYTKGNLQILKEKSIAIVGSRDAESKSLQFTDNIARIASKEFKVIVSGFAKGVDKQALDSAIKYNGQSIIVLPQGILTFTSGFKNYYKQIIEGNVIVVSTFPPKAGWNVGLAMTRNQYIYGLASEIYVAQSAEKGGTWEGVLDGIKKNRTVFVRKPDSDEKNANNILIEKGAIPVDFEGNIINVETKVINSDKKNNSKDQEQIKTVKRKSNKIIASDFIQPLF